jgi:hypothetical protein
MTTQPSSAAPRGDAGDRLLLPVPGLDVATTWQVGPVLFHPVGTALELIDAMPTEHRRPTSRPSRRGLMTVSPRSVPPQSLRSP